MQTLKVEMIHDLVCSWCHIGYHHISQALDRLTGEVEAEFHYLPFQLNPDLDSQGVDITEHLCLRNQWSLAEAMDYRARLLQKTKEVGVTIDFSKRTRYYNTAMAHRLMLAAGNHGLQRQMHQALLQAYHVKGENISDVTVLKKIAESIGFDEAMVNQALISEAIDQRLSGLVSRINNFNVRSVPAFIFNENRFVSGSNSAEFFAQLIRSEFLTGDLAEEPVEEAIQCPM